MDSFEVKRLFKIWQSLRTFRCECKDHFKIELYFCDREKAWRNYCAARDKLIADIGETGKLKPNLKDVMEAFDRMTN